MAQSKILVGLEIGTSKTCMVVGEIRPDATATIIGVGEVPSAGVRKGEIVDQTFARQCVCDAWQLAQDHAEVDILNVFLSVTGDHIVGENHTGSYRLPDDENIIEYDHMNLAREKAEKAEIPADRLGTVEEVATMVAQLTEAPPYLTGQIITIDGGWC